MKYIIFFLSIILSIVEARENPFFPKEGLEDIPYATNITKSSPPLKRAAISLPSQARIIEKVTVTYKTLEGSVETKTVELQNTVDWHLPIFISQNYEASTSDVKQSTKNTKKNATKPITKTVTSEKSIEKGFKLLAKKSYISFASNGKKLKIETKNKLIRDFLMVKPHRIVLDFKKVNDVGLKAYTKKNENEVFKIIKIGNHSGYYRVVIELDGYYRYKIKNIKDGYIFTLK
jgi:hypothetical protein